MNGLADTGTDMERPISPTALAEFDDFLNSIPSPSPNENFLEDLLKHLDDAGATDNAEKAIDDGNSKMNGSTVNAGIDTTTSDVNGSKAKTKGRWAKTKKATAPKKKPTKPGDLVLQFNGADFLNFLTSSADKSSKSEPRQPPERMPPISDAEIAIENKNVRLMETNQRIRRELKSLQRRQMTYEDEITVIRSRLYYDSRLAPYLQAAGDRCVFGPMHLSIPLSALDAVPKKRPFFGGQRPGKRSNNTSGSETPTSSISVSSTVSDHGYFETDNSDDTNDDGNGICLHFCGDTLFMEHCDYCDDSAQRRAAESV